MDTMTDDLCMQCLQVVIAQKRESLKTRKINNRRYTHATMSSELFRTDLHDPVLILSAATDLTTEQSGYEASYATGQPPVIPADTETTQGSVE